jgi:hypothetical protein
MGDITVFRLLLGLGACALATIDASQASAQELFGNPFASATAVRAQRGEMPKATLRLKYAASAEPKDKQQAGELVLDVASDWAQVQHGARRTVYDFRLGRVLELQDDGTFLSRGLMGDVAFRVAERQNRTGLTAVMRGAGLTDKWDACDAETELGVVIPGSKEPAAVELKKSGATTTLECNGRVVGLFEGGNEKKTPAALWPVLAHVITMHPALRTPMAEGGAAPKRVEATFRLAGNSKTLAWRLLSAEPISEPYPLAADRVNATAPSLNKTVAPGLGDIAAEAVAGRAAGGPPTLAAWEALVTRTAQEKGAAAAVLALWPAINMFPQAMQACQTGTRSSICDALRDLRQTMAADTAVRALLLVGAAEQARRPADAIAAMAAARSSPHADHPALAATFALALHAGGPAMQKQAVAAGVPGEAVPLHVKALQAYPYSPAYWTDLGDYFARGYQLHTAYLLYDVALSLPMPDAQRGSPVVAGKRSLATRIRGDFPAFFLSK